MAHTVRLTQFQVEFIQQNLNCALEITSPDDDDELSLILNLLQALSLAVVTEESVDETALDKLKIKFMEGQNCP